MAPCQYAYPMEKETRAATNRDSDKYIVRFPEGMRDRIAEAAKANNRSMNAEIVARLESTFAQQRDLFSPVEMMDLLKRIDDRVTLAVETGMARKPRGK